MIAVIVHRVCVHVSNAEDVDEHTEEGCYEEEHHCDVIDVYPDSKDLLFDFHRTFANPTKTKPITNVM